MEFSRVVSSRRMIRRFESAVDVSQVQLEKIIECGLAAPSAGHTQGVELLLLQGADVGVFWSLTSDPGTSPSEWLRGLRSAPVLILVWTSEATYRRRYAEADKRGKGKEFSAPYWWVDAGMCVDQMLLAAVDEGLAGCFFGVPPERQEALADGFGVPSTQSSVGVVALGQHSEAGSGAGGSARRPKRGWARVHRGAWSAEAKR